MLTTKPPFSEFEPMTAIYNIGAGRIKPGIPDDLSDSLRDLLQQCFKRDPRFRPSATDLLSHPFFKTGRIPSNSLESEENIVCLDGDDVSETNKNIVTFLCDVKDKVKNFIQKCLKSLRRCVRQCIVKHC